MNAKDLQAELRDSLTRGTKIAWGVSIEPQTRSLTEGQREALITTLENLAGERAANLAAGMADRTHADADTTEGLAIEALKHAAELMREALAGKTGVRHNDRRRLALGKIEDALKMWGQS